MNWYKIAQENSQPSPNGFLWHGTTQKINGPLEPRQAHDIGGSPTSNMNAIYATPNRDFAIMMGLTERGSDVFTNHSQSPLQLVLVNGKIRHGQQMYLYKLPKDTFTDTGDVQEWVSQESVMPISEEVLNVDDYLHLIRQPNKSDMQFWNSNQQ